MKKFFEGFRKWSNLSEEQILAEGSPDPGRLSVKSATEAIAARFPGAYPETGLPRQGQGSSRGAKTMFTIRNYAVFDDPVEQEAAWAELVAEGEELEPADYSKYPPVLWRGVVIRNVPFHGYGNIYKAIGVASAQKIQTIDEEIK